MRGSGPPTTFTRRGHHVVTILSRKQGRNLDPDVRDYCLRAIASRYKYRDAVEMAVDHGLVADRDDYEETIEAVMTRD